MGLARDFGFCRVHGISTSRTLVTLVRVRTRWRRSSRVRGTWVPGGRVRMGRHTGLAVNAGAVVWLAFETVNIA